MENVIQEIAQYLKNLPDHELATVTRAMESRHRCSDRCPSAGQSRCGQPLLQIGSLDVQLRNLYGTDDRNITPYGQLFKKNHLPEIVSTAWPSAANYDATTGDRSKQANHNRSAVAPRTGHVAGEVRHFVHDEVSESGQRAGQRLYDGTVQVSTGGTEMGQGLNVKIRQLVADEFGLPVERVLVMATSTEKNINTSPTAASAGTDLNGAAAVNACRQIKDATGRICRAAICFGSNWA